MPGSTATRAATPSATSPPPARCASRRWRRSAWAVPRCCRGVAAPESPRAAFGRMAERSPGKDSVTGHWELMGLVLERPFPTFPHGFPAALIDAFAARIGRAVLGNVVASGTAIIDALGDAAPAQRPPDRLHLGRQRVPDCGPRGVVPVAQLYDWCHVAYELAVEGLGIGRVIARPFVGDAGRLHRAPPTATTSRCRRRARRCSIGLPAAGVPVTAIGKVGDLFAGRGIARVAPDHERRPMAWTARGCARRRASRSGVRQPGGLRQPVRPPQRRRRLRRQPRALRPPARSDCRHGSAPTTCWSSPPTTATTRRRRAPITRASTCRCCVAGAGCAAGVDLGIRDTFADVGQTLAEVFGVEPLPARHQPARRTELRPVGCDHVTPASPS